MTRSVRTLRILWRVAHRLRVAGSAGKSESRVRRAASQCTIEILEDRRVPATIRVTSLLDSGAGTLRAAIERADRAPKGVTITFARSVTGTIELTSALPVLSANLAIFGPGPSMLTVARSSVPGTPAFGIFTVASGAKVAIFGLTITGGSAAVGGGIDNAGSLSLVNATISGNSAAVIGSAYVSSGGGIRNTGTLSVADCLVSGNSVTSSIDRRTGENGGGGGIWNSGTLSITGSTIDGNSDRYGDGGGGIMNTGRLSVAGSAIGGNSVTAGSLRVGNIGWNENGGGIWNSGLASIASSTISGNSVTGGTGQVYPHGGSGGSGGGGGILNVGTLSVSGSTFAGNSATGGDSSGTGLGGGIDNSGTLSVADCTFVGNSARGDSNITNGGDARGGGIWNFGTLSVTDSTFLGNMALGGRSTDAISGVGSGGGIANDDGRLSLVDSTISDNSAASAGGGIESGGMLSIAGCTISGNSATQGGGIVNYDSLSITNATISGNSAADDGGGIYNSGTMSISFATVADNSAGSGGGIATSSFVPTTAISIDSIYQNPQGGNVNVTAGSLFGSLGGNIFSDAPNTSSGLSDLVNTDPLLGPLASNGGPTLTQALLPGSPAIGGGFPIGGIATDQRGAPRPLDRAPDIGAFQVQPPLAVVGLKRYGVHDRPTTLVLTFNLPLDVARAESPANYRLVAAGPDHRVGAGNAGVIAMRSVAYDPASQTVSLRPSRRLPLRRTYFLTVIGTPPGGLTTTVGAYLAGAADGRPGTDYVASITRSSLVWPQPH